jgi:polyphosphate kinase
LPEEGSTIKIILLDDIIRYCLDDIFPIIDYTTAKAFTVKITRDAELDIDTDHSKSWIEKVEKSVKQRKRGTPVRLTYDQSVPKDLLGFILRKVKLQKKEYLTPGGRYHNFKDFINFPPIGNPKLRYQSLAPLEHPDFAGKRSLLEVISKKDVLLMYPYHSFSHIIDLLREASIDEKVQSIYITLYRAAINSSVVNALVNAIKNGKQVTAVVELQARFDEETNIAHANKLQEEGVNVIFGVPGLKVHSKLFLITRKENGKLINYAHIGTGNFNENTAKVYTDHSLLTVDPRITREVQRLFDFYKDNYKSGHYKHIFVSPFNTRKRFLKLIDNEIENVKNNQPAWIILKMNSLFDKEMVDKLYDAGRAGVKISLIVRGICSLVTGLKEIGDNIRVISIVDRFLEHSRIYAFCNNQDNLYFLSSGDWMYRNLDHRSEVTVPVYSKDIQQSLRTYLEHQLADNIKARLIDSEQQNNYVLPVKIRSHRAQLEIYRQLRAQTLGTKK